MSRICLVLLSIFLVSCAKNNDVWDKYNRINSNKSLSGLTNSESRSQLSDIHHNGVKSANSDFNYGPYRASITEKDTLIQDS